jgi:hypothetical protein
MYQFEMIIFIAFKALLSLFNDLIRGESKWNMHFRSYSRIALDVILTFYWTCICLLSKDTGVYRLSLCKKLLKEQSLIVTTKTDESSDSNKWTYKGTYVLPSLRFKVHQIPNTYKYLEWLVAQMLHDTGVKGLFLTAILY